MIALAAVTALILLTWAVQAGPLTLIALSVLAAAVLIAPAPTRPRRQAGRPGASCDDRARRLRTPRVRLADALGISTRRGRQADNCQAGAQGERYVATLLTELEAEGWQFLYDRALPHSRANVDVVALSPRGCTYVLDPKQWSARYRLRVHGERLWHGNHDVTERLNGLKYETRTVARLLGVDVVPLAVMIGPLARGFQLRLDGIRIVPADDICAVLRRLDDQRLPHPRRPDIHTAARLLPPYPRSS
ncbi:NERD domain-containing protein [Streptomyces sp. NPDC059063]|uniref:NERD domain-containing protein n=1 Tax=Streptomyces sp. NPDC059063 TaxID=3346712 RepID=UPI0036970B62